MSRRTLSSGREWLVMAKRISRLPRQQIEKIAEFSIEWLDSLDAPTEDLEREEDRCEAFDDRLVVPALWPKNGAGTPEDAEPEEDRCEAGEDLGTWSDHAGKNGWMQGEGEVLPANQDRRLSNLREPSASPFSGPRSGSLRAPSRMLGIKLRRAFLRALSRRLRCLLATFKRALASSGMGRAD